MALARLELGGDDVAAVKVERVVNGFIVHTLDEKKVVVANDDAESLGRIVISSLGVGVNCITPLVRAMERARA